MRIIILLLILCRCVFCCAQQTEHVVKRGESFSSIAKLYSISEQELKKANSASSICYIGRKLIIPIGITSKEAAQKVQEQDIQLQSNDSTILTKSSVTSYQVGQALWHHHKYEEATIYLLDAAEKGEARAFYPLADCFAKKESASYSEKDAVFWFLKSATSNNKSLEGYWQSCQILAQRYQRGEGVNKNLSEAYKYCSEYHRYAPQYERGKAKSLLNEIKEEDRKLALKRKREYEIVKNNNQQAIITNNRQSSVGTRQSNVEFKQEVTDSKSSYNSQNQQNSNRRVYSTPPDVEDIYFKNKSGHVIKLKLWHISEHRSGNSQFDNYFNSLISSHYSEWAANIDPYGISAKNKFSVKNDYFEYLSLFNGSQIACIKVAKDLSWVSCAYTLAGDKEIIYNIKATKREYDKYEQSYKKTSQQMVNGGNIQPHDNGSSNKFQLEKLPKRHGDVICKGCNGNGKCNTCGGTGKRVSSEYDATLGRSGITLSSCPICRGTGNCGVCYGTGRIHY